MGRTTRTPAASKRAMSASMSSTSKPKCSRPSPVQFGDSLVVRRSLGFGGDVKSDRAASVHADGDRAGHDLSRPEDLGAEVFGVPGGGGVGVGGPDVDVID